MELILSPKADTSKLVLKDVELFTPQGDTLLVVFKDGRTRHYPLMHLWYYESNIPAGEGRSKPPIESINKVS